MIKLNWLLPPVLLAICAAAMAALDRIWPGLVLIDGAWRWGGAAVTALGLVVAGAGRRQFQKAKANIRTFGAPNRLVTDGIFRFTRNPMYLGFAVALFGWGLVLGSLTPFAVWLGFLAACAFWYIPYEEARMASAFGDAYAAYRTRTRRWL